MLKIQHVLPFLLLTGCAVRQPFPATWRLTGSTLAPPGVTAGLAQRTFNVLSPDEVLPTLVLTRLWAGKPVALEFDRSKPDELSLVFTGNEQIRW